MVRIFEDGLDYAKKMDVEDELNSFRDRFYLQEDTIYMDGNSLGLCSKDSEQAILRILEEWKTLGIGCWSDGAVELFTYHDYLSKLTAPLINCSPDEVTVHANTTINIHTCMGSFYKPTKDRYKILVDDLNFPTDRYAIEGQIRIKGLDVEECLSVVKSRDGKYIYEDDIIEAMKDDVAIVFLPAVLYRSGQLVDMKKITKHAHSKGILVGWDLCHSIGAIPHDFEDINPDFAVWCNYKYLNGGPGTSGGLYINKNHFELESGLPGWHGNKKETQFELNNEFEKENRASGWQSGTQPVISMGAIEGGLKIYEEAGIHRLREKSLHITAYLMYLIESKLTQYGFTIGNPKEDSKRGGHIALEHEDAIRINSALKDKGVVPDFRYPNVIRLAPVPLYVSYEDVYMVVEKLVDIMELKLYEGYENKIGVTA